MLGLVKRQLPSGFARPANKAEFDKTVLGMIHERWAHYKGARKLLARAVECTPRTADNYLGAEHAPLGYNLMLLARKDAFLRSYLTEMMQPEAGEDAPEQMTMQLPRNLRLVGEP